MSGLLQIGVTRDSNHRAAAYIFDALEQGSHVALFGRVGSGITPFLKLLASKNKRALYHRPVDKKMCRIALPPHHGRFLILDDAMVGIGSGLPPIDASRAGGVVAFLNTDKVNRVAHSWGVSLPNLTIGRVLELPKRGVFLEHDTRGLLAQSPKGKPAAHDENISFLSHEVFA